MRNDLREKKFPLLPEPAVPTLVHIRLFAGTTEKSPRLDAKLSEFERYAFQQNLLNISAAKKKSDSGREDAEYLVTVFQEVIYRRLVHARVSISELLPRPEIFDDLLCFGSWPDAVEVAVGLDEGDPGNHRWELLTPPGNRPKTTRLPGNASMEFMHRFLEAVHPAVYMLQVTGKRLELNYENQPWMNSRFLHICRKNGAPIFSVCEIRGGKVIEGDWDGREIDLLKDAFKEPQRCEVTRLRSNEISRRAQAEVGGLDREKFTRLVAGGLVRAFSN